MRRPLALALAALSAAGLVRPPLRAADYFVAPDGQDRTGGGGRSSPWASLGFAAGRVRPGDQVTVLPGRYAGFYLATGGTANRPIRFTALPGVVIDRRNPRTPDGINLEGAGHVTLEGFEVVGMPRAGVRITHGAHVTVRRVRASRNGVWGLYASFCDDLTLERNQASGSIKQHGIYVANSSDRPILRGNTVWGNSGAGIHLNGDASEGGDGVITGALVEGNVIHDNGATGASAINCDGVESSRILNNLLYNNHASGVSLFRQDGGGPSRDNVVANNTIVMAADARWAVNIRDGGTGNRVYNNILMSASRSNGSINIDADCLAGFASDFNALVDRMAVDGERIGSSRWVARTGQDRRSFVADRARLFADPAGHDYHLAPGSAAIDSGYSPAAPPEDLEGHPRPQGLGIDLGAYESGVPGTAPAPAAVPRPGPPGGRAARDLGGSRHPRRIAFERVSTAEATWGGRGSRVTRSDRRSHGTSW
jgi:parallel beta-helix repeat protein